jgi:hypothetical protein
MNTTGFNYWGSLKTLSGFAEEKVVLLPPVIAWWLWSRDLRAIRKAYPGWAKSPVC